MLPVIALVGRPNVGKSTLFNQLTRSRDALVADQPGLTRDRQYGFGRVGPGPYIVVDTGGLSGVEDGLDGLMAQQTQAAVQEANVVLFMVDGREGLSGADGQVADLLRRQGANVWLVVNKCEGQQPSLVTADFFTLGIGEPVAIAATHGQGVRELMDAVFEQLEEDGVWNAVEAAEAEKAQDTNRDIRVAVVGRPNVGKSTLINRLIGEDRLVAFDLPGTTRDAVDVPFERDGQAYTLVDTAGVRRRARVSEAIEKFSVIKTLQAIDKANVVIAVLDASEGVAEQDVTLLGMTLERGRALVIAVNKWDGLVSDQRNFVRRELERKLPFLDFARILFVSALHGTAVGNLLPEVKKAYRAACKELATPALTRVLEQAVMEHPPPLSKGRRPRLRYAHQGGRNPPVIVVHGTQTDRLAESYRRFLTNRFRKAFSLQGTPIRVQFKAGTNPYAGKTNKLTPRQQAKRKRLMKHVKGRK